MIRVQLCLHDQACTRRRVCDQANDRLVADQRLPSPILSDEAEQPVLDLVPLAGTRREMADVELQSEFVGQGLQRPLPQTCSMTVAATAVGRDQQLSGLGE